MNKKVLAVYYSQTGQMGDIIDQFTAPLAKEGVTVDKLHIKPQKDYPFPWSGDSFFAVMPDCNFGVPTPLAYFNLKEKKYDLIILGYQAWFLSPSIPTNSILSDPAIKEILKDTPVVIITGARNMWINAMLGVKKLLGDADAKLVGNIALVDKHHNLVSFVTILYWMFGGKKDRYLNIFPKPGVADADIEHTKVFGETVNKYLKKGDFEGMQQDLLKDKAVEIKDHIMFVEMTAKRMFGIWANAIVKKKNRKGWLRAFKYYIIFALLIVAPIVLTIRTIFFKPFLLKSINRQKQYFSDVK